jgi:hypothetical protein
MELLMPVLLLCMLGCVTCFLQSKRIQLAGNGYTGMTVAISDKLDPTEINVNKLKVRGTSTKLDRIQALYLFICIVYRNN